jgi:hypothetical protein
MDERMWGTDVCVELGWGVGMRRERIRWSEASGGGGGLESVESELVRVEVEAE